MSDRFPPILHRLAAVAILLAVIVAVLGLVVLPLGGRYSDLRAEIGRQRELLGRFEAFAANRDAAQTVASQAREAMNGGMFLAGETDALRTANLQALVTGIAEKGGVRLSSTRSLPVQAQDGLRLLGVQAEFETDMKRLQAIVTGLETQRPVIFVQSMQTAPAASRRRESDELRVRIGVFGAVAAAGEAKP